MLFKEQNEFDKIMHFNYTLVFNIFDFKLSLLFQDLAPELNGILDPGSKTNSKMCLK